MKEEAPGTSAFIEKQSIRPELNAAMELLYTFLEEYSADMSRIYVTGSSNGGGGTWDLIYRCKGLFAAAIPLAGAKVGDAHDLYADGVKDVAIWTFHGDKDINAGAGNMNDKINQSASGRIFYSQNYEVFGKGTFDGVNGDLEGTWRINIPYSPYTG